MKWQNQSTVSHTMANTMHILMEEQSFVKRKQKRAITNSKAFTICIINKPCEDHPDVADTYNNIAIVYKKQGKYEEALEYYNKALTIYINKLGEDHPYTKLTQNNIRICKNLKEELGE